MEKGCHSAAQPIGGKGNRTRARYFPGTSHRLSRPQSQQSDSPSSIRFSRCRGCATAMHSHCGNPIHPPPSANPFPAKPCTMRASGTPQCAASSTGISTTSRTFHSGMHGLSNLPFRFGGACRRHESEMKCRPACLSKDPALHISLLHHG